MTTIGQGASLLTISRNRRPYEDSQMSLTQYNQSQNRDLIIKSYDDNLNISQEMKTVEQSDDWWL